MNTRFRQVFAPLVQGLLFLAFLAGLNLMGWDKSIPCVIAATILSVTVAYQVWPSSPVTLALTMILVSVVLPLSSLYVVANWGESQAPFWGIVNMVDWRRTFLPTITAVASPRKSAALPAAARSSCDNLIVRRDCYDNLRSQANPGGLAHDPVSA